MAKGEVIINEQICRGCGYCAHFCSRGAIEIPGDRISSQGYSLPVFAHPEKCNGCGVCGWLCPSFSLEVYRIKE